MSNSLSHCLGKAGKAISQENKDAILERSSALRGKGLGVDAAAEQAVAEHIEKVRTARATLAVAPDVAEPIPSGTAPEHVTTGVDDRELGQIALEFNNAQQRMIDSDETVTHVFDAPSKNDVVRLADKAKIFHKDHGWMTPAQAKAKIAEWKAHTTAQGEEAHQNGNAQRIVLSLFDLTGSWSKPWEEAGYQVFRFDIQDDPEMGDVTKFDTEFFNDNFGAFDGQDVYAILAACPCTDFAVSGARHFAAKDTDGRTVASVKLVHQTLATIEHFKPAVWGLENPVGRIEKLGGLPPWRLSFDPNQLGDPYTKKTLIWGRFNGDLPVAPVEPTEGSKMHKLYGGKSQATKNARSETTEGFSYGFFLANNAVDNPVMAIANKYDRLDRALLTKAVEAGITEREIDTLVEDAYYIDLDDAAAERALREAIAAPSQRDVEELARENATATTEAAGDNFRKRTSVDTPDTQLEFYERDGAVFATTQDDTAHIKRLRRAGWTRVEEGQAGATQEDNLTQEQGGEKAASPETAGTQADLLDSAAPAAEKLPEQMTEAEFGAIEQAKAVAEAERALAAAKAGNMKTGALTGYKSKADAVRQLTAELEKQRAAKPEVFAGDHLAEINKAVRAGRAPSPENVERYQLAPVANTEDAGAELAYNKRNRMGGGLKWADIEGKDAALRVSETKKAKVYPRPDYATLVNGGMEPLVAHIVKQAYDAIAVSPQVRGAPTDEQLKTYIQGVNRFMAGVTAWANDGAQVAQWLVALGKRAGAFAKAAGGAPTAMSSMVEVPQKSLLEAVYGPKWRDHQDEVRIIGGNKVLSALQPSTDDAIKAMKEIEKGWPGKREAWQARGYRVVDGAADKVKADYYEGKNGDGTAYVYASVDLHDKSRRITLARQHFDVTSKDDPAVQAWVAETLPKMQGQQLLLNKGNTLQGAFATEAEAIDKARALTKRDASGTEVSDKGISVEAAERIGPQRRMEGQNVSSDEVKDAFGFKGVNFGNWMKGQSNTAERQLHLNHAFDAFMDLAEVMGVPPQAMSLNGMLGLAVGAQGNGQYAAHFVPGMNEINLTRTSGAGSLAHEWGHALDHYFARLAGLERSSAPFLTEHARTGVSGELRPEIMTAFKGIVEAMNKRQVTEEEAAAQQDAAVQRTRKRVSSWLNAIRKDFERNAEKALSQFDELAGEIGEDKFGDGQVGKFYPVVDAIRQAYKDATGHLYSQDQAQGLHGNLEHLKYLVTDRDAAATHEPQMVGTEYAKNAGKLDKDKGGKPYWSTNLEKFARAFDAFVSDQLEAKAVKNTYLSHAGREGETVPSGAERNAINAGIQKLVETIETKPTDKGVAMFSRADQTGTDAFKAWFGDSKVVDADGKPLVVYHGTNRDFDSFAEGAYFTPSPQVASDHADWRVGEDGGGEASVRPVYLSIKNPIVMEDTSSLTYEHGEIARLQRQGHDGAISSDRQEFIAFKPEQIKSAIGNNGDFDPANPSINMSRADMRRGQAGVKDALTKGQVERAIQKLTMNWLRKPSVKILETLADAPDAVIHEWLRQNEGGAGGGVKGFHLEGDVYLIADQLTSGSDVIQVLFHEALGHFGLRGVFGESLTPILKQIATLRGKEMAAKAEQYGLDLSKEEDRLTAAEEILANMAETHPELGFVRRAIAAIRTWLRAHVPGFDDMKLSDDEIIRSYILPARAFVVDGAVARGAVAAAPTQFARGDKVSPLRPKSPEDKLAAMGFRVEHNYEDEPAFIEAHDGTVYDWDEGSQRFEDEDGNPLPQEAADIAQFIGNQRDGIEDQGEQVAGGANDRQFNQRGKPMFSRAATITGLTAAQEAALDRVGGVLHPETMKERFDKMRANIGDKLKRGLVDQFAPIKDLDQDAYMLSRLSKGGDGTMEAAMLYGRPFLRDGVPDVDVNEGGFAKVLATLKGEHDRFLWWVASQRAELLAAEGRENLFQAGDIAALKTMDKGDFADGTPRAPVFAAALAKLNSFNESTLKMALESGLIGQEAYDAMKDQPYVPFYRLMEDGDMPKFGARGGLVNQYAYKKLKGGKDKLQNDLLQNMLLNWSHLYTASARNRAAQATMAAAVNAAIAYKVPSGTKKAVKVVEGGQDTFYAVEDPYLLEAISSLHYVPSPLVKPLAALKNVLTLGVTANPAFKIRNLIRDSIAAPAQSELGFNPIKNIAEGWAGSAHNSQTYASMLASGGVLKFGSMEDSSRVRKQIHNLGGSYLDKEGWQKLTGQMASLWEAYQDFGDRGENVNRVALYQQLLKKGHTHAEASFMARDLMDFSMSGQWGAVRFLAQTVPFFNARLQGLYKLGRAAAEDPKKFGIVAGSVMLASLALMAGYQDDDDWKKREDWDRDSNWWFKIGETAFRIPKPFEIGAMGTLAERTAELAFNDEMTGARFRERLSNMLFQTFAFDPTPQAVKPLLDVYANKDSFTGRPIEGFADEHLRPQDRASERTSQAGLLLGAMGLPDPVQLAKGNYQALSPKQVDFLLRGYFGWFGTTAMTVSDYSIRPMSDAGARPAMQLRDVFLAGNFVEGLPTGSSRYVTQLYEQSKAVEQAYGSYKAALKSGDKEEAAAILEAEGPKVRAYHAVERIKKGEATMSSQMRSIASSKEMTADEKRARIDQLEAKRDQLARKMPAIQ